MGTVPREITMDQFSTLCRLYVDICDREPSLYQYDFRSKRSVDAWRKRRSIWRDIYGEEYEVDDLQDDYEQRLKTNS